MVKYGSSRGRVRRMGGVWESGRDYDCEHHRGLTSVYNAGIANFVLTYPFLRTIWPSLVFHSQAHDWSPFLSILLVFDTYTALAIKQPFTLLLLGLHCPRSLLSAVDFTVLVVPWLYTSSTQQESSKCIQYACREYSVLVTGIGPLRWVATFPNDCI